MTFSLPSDSAWCDRHRQPGAVCAAETRCCHFGRTRPLEPSWMFDDHVDVATTTPLRHGAKAVHRNARSYATNPDRDAAENRLGGKGDGQHPAGMGSRCVQDGGGLDSLDKLVDGRLSGGFVDPGPSPAAVTDGGRETEGGPGPLHLSMYDGRQWRCWCGAIHVEPWGHP